MSERSLSYVEVEMLLSRLYRALDASDPDALAACFTDEAIWHRPDGPKTGTDAIRTVATDRAANRATSHIPSNLIVEQVGEELVAQYYLTVYEHVEGEQARLFACLDCEDRLTKSGDGLKLVDKRAHMRMKFA